MDDGIPALLLWGTWLLLPAIVLLEALVAKRLLGIGWRRALIVSTRANLASVPVGILLLWGLAVVTAPLQWRIDWVLPAVAASYCLLSLFVVVECEYFVAKRSVQPRLYRRVHFWAWSANALSSVLVIALAFGYLFAISAGMRGVAWRSSCRANLNVIGAAVARYRREHQDRLPPAADFASLARLLKPDLAVAMEQHGRKADSFRREQLLHCPETGKEYLFNVALSGASGASIQRPHDTPTVRDAVPHDDGWRCVLFADGHSRCFPLPTSITGRAISGNSRC